MGDGIGLATGTLVRLFHNSDFIEIQDIDVRMALVDSKGRQTFVERRHFNGQVPVFSWVTPDNTIIRCTADTKFQLADGRRLTPYELKYEQLDVLKLAVYTLHCVPYNSFQIVAGPCVVGER